MSQDQVQQILEKAPMIVIGSLLGGVLMYTLGHAPHFIDVSWGPEGSRIQIDSRSGNWCELEK
ncbi:hypothetical protein [Adonisia turfae]|uniref:Uncharacterized protein n=1 Tax=Adonisia turfae CCMR0081 TaxID=2292702 RepID=A0A6M0RCQ7_9CYAN|nr:hypothetical protein [Adonisia turfae]NEZ54129.1 hypothetical protein [Adonisia turfae CCMR0081]